MSDHKLKVESSAVSGLVLTCDKCEFVSTTRAGFVDYLVSVQRTHNASVHEFYLDGSALKCSALNCGYTYKFTGQMTVAVMHKMERDHIEERKRA